MKILIITPTVHREGMERMSPFWLPPLGAATVSAVIPSEIEVKIIDENVEDIDFDEKVDLVAVSFLTSQAWRAYTIADRFRERGIPVVLGGYHASALPEESKEHADAVVIGEAEGNWDRLICDFKNNDLKPFYRNSALPSLVHPVLARRDLYKADKYLTTNTIQTTRGCPFNCEFCSVTGFYQHTYREKPIEAVVDEIKSMKAKNKSLFFIVDDEITADKERAKKLFKALIPLKIKWWSQATLRNLASNDELLKLAVESGCIVAVVGLETLIDENLKVIGKYQNSLALYEEQIAKVQEAGIIVNPSFSFGNEFDDESVFETTIDFIYRNKIAITTFNILTPLPGTRLFERLESEQRILTHDWSKYDMGHCVYQPKMISPERLEELFNDTSKSFYSMEAIKKRLAYVPRDKRSLIFGWNMGYKRLLDTFGVLM